MVVLVHALLLYARRFTGRFENIEGWIDSCVVFLLPFLNFCGGRGVREFREFRDEVGCWCG
jgi:hypothetical protein